MKLWAAAGVGIAVLAYFASLSNLILITLGAFLAYGIYRYYEFVSRYPKGPFPFPFIGNVTEVGLFFLFPHSSVVRICSDRPQSTPQVIGASWQGSERHVHHVHTAPGCANHRFRCDARGIHRKRYGIWFNLINARQNLESFFGKSKKKLIQEKPSPVVRRTRSSRKCSASRPMRVICIFSSISRPYSHNHFPIFSVP